MSTARATAEKCKRAILEALYIKKELGFEEIVSECRVCSRSSVNKYLGQLYSDGSVEQTPGRWRRKYYLSEKARIYTGKLIFMEKFDITGESSPKEIKKALADIEKIITAALQTPDDQLNAFFSCVWEIGEKSGFSNSRK